VRVFAHDFSAASFIEDMLNASSNAFGGGFVDRKASTTESLPSEYGPLYRPQSQAIRVYWTRTVRPLTYVGPSDSDSVYSVPLARYAIKDTTPFQLRESKVRSLVPGLHLRLPNSYFKIG
jgi:hypothetical protein